MPESTPQATPQPRPLGAGAGFQPNAFAASCRTRRIRSSPMLRSRNSTGSSPAAAAMTSTWDSRAHTFMFAPGARQGPVPKR